MKTLLCSLLTCAQISLASAAAIVVPNGDFSSAVNNGTLSGSLLGGGQTAAPLGSGPWNVQTTGIGGLLAPPTATIGGGTAQASGLLGLGVVGQSNGAQFSQTLSGVSYQANMAYTLTTTIRSGTALDLGLLGQNGIGIALTRGGNTNLVASSTTAAPGLISLSPLGGSNYALSLTYLSPASPLTGDIGIRLFAGSGASLATASLLGNVSFDNVTLAAVPEPSLTGLFVIGLCGIAAGRSRAWIRGLAAIAAALMLIGTVPGRAGLLGPVGSTQSPLGGVTLLPNTAYNVAVQVSTTDLQSLLGILSSQPAPVQLLDGTGNVLGNISPTNFVADLLGGGQVPLLDNLGNVLGLVSADDLAARLLGTSTSPLPVLGGNGNLLGSLSVTNLLNAILGPVLGSSTNLNLLDGLGNVIGTVSVDKLLQSITNAGGGLANPVNMILTTAGEKVLDPVLSVLDTPLLQVGGTTVLPAAVLTNNPTPGNRPPTVHITSKKRAAGGRTLVLRGTAADADGGITRIEVQQNGRQAKVKGTEAWTSRLTLRNGPNRIVARAFDRGSTVSQPQRVTVVQR